MIFGEENSYSCPQCDAAQHALFCGTLKSSYLTLRQVLLFYLCISSIGLRPGHVRDAQTHPRANLFEIARIRRRMSDHFEPVAAMKDKTFLNTFSYRSMQK
jgi:hypothetical protein